MIDDKGQVLGIMPLRDAINRAKDSGIDLVEMSSGTNPPTCKLMDYGKWKFQNKKKEKERKKNQVKVLIKELQLRPRTDENDINIKLQKAREFLSDGHKVKINVLFSGREMAHKEIGFQLLEKVKTKLEDVAFVESEAKMERRSLFAIFANNANRPASKDPKKVSTEPKKVSTEPKKVSTEPKKVSTEPKKVSTEPKKVSTEPKKVSTEPKKVSAEPKKVSAEPKKVSTDSKKVSTDSKKVSADSKKENKVSKS